MDLSSHQSKSIVIIPTYNESANLSALVEELLLLGVPGLNILVVDDNSPDGTGYLADNLAKKYYGILLVLHRQRKEGLGRAYMDGMTFALNLGADFIVQMDADFSHPPSVIPQMLAEIQNYDVIIGSRFVKGGRIDEQWSWWRRFLSWWANRVWSGIILGIKVSDITAGFKCWRRETLVGIGLDRIFSNGYAFQVEMAYMCERLGYNILEIPIYFEDRRIGESKMDMRVKLQGAIDVIRIWKRHRKTQRRPLEVMT
jgi:dolichol-phosphate mannosyltransferase